MEDDDECLHAYGTPLEALDEDNVAAKKPIYAEDQIATDEHGRRRFHGAFTGGFVAGFMNTVGSLHGWVPQTYTSSRSEKAEKKVQKPEDFMDDEDLGEFGIAPQVIQASDDFAKEKGSRALKRKLLQPSFGPIPGQPVLSMLLQPVKDKAAVRILKALGWKAGQGIGPRQTRKQKKAANARNERELYVWQRYCDDEDMKKTPMSTDGENNQKSEEDDDEDDDDEITFAPDDIEPLFLRPKTDTFGFGYTGLLGQSSSQLSASKGSERSNRFDSLELLDRNNKKVLITGHGFGVGAMEEEDDDIYARDDLKKYDFSLESKGVKKKHRREVQDQKTFANFIEDTSKPIQKMPFVVNLPPNFKPRNWLIRKSRFEPLPEERKREIERTLKEFAINRSNLDADKRSMIFGEPSNLPKTYKNPFKSPPRNQTDRIDRSKDLLELISAKSNNFTTGGLITESGKEKGNDNAREEENLKEIMEKAANKTKHLVSASNSLGFKPFLTNEDKQERYDKFVKSKLTNENDIKQFLIKLQPAFMSDWDREKELREFIQARKIYKPLEGIMSERFVSESGEVEMKKIKTEENTAVKKKIQMERTKVMWKPSSLLCKRYNIAETLIGGMEDENEQKSKPKISVFDYLDTSVNKKEDFQCPVIIPKHIEKIIPAAIPNEMSMPIAEASNTASSSSLATPRTSERKSNVKSFKYVPKTKLEEDLQENKEKHLSKKIELYEAIFADSDDENDKKDAIKAEPDVTVKNELLKDSVDPKAAALLNVLRNTSPPKGLFENFFKVGNISLPPVRWEKDPKNESSCPDKHDSALPKVPPSTIKKEVEERPKIIFQSRTNRKSETTTEEDPPQNLYGPALPSHLKEKSHYTEDRKDFAASSSFSFPSSVSFMDYKWVEKTGISSSSDSESTSDDSTDSDEKLKKKSKHKKKNKKSDKKKSKRKEKKKEKSKKHDKKYSVKKEKSHKKSKKKNK